MRTAALAVIATACGRIGFAPGVPDAKATGRDAASTADASTCTFCDDFDQDPPFGRWDGAVGAPALSTTDFVSGPRAMEVAATSVPSYERKDLPGAWTHLDCAFQLEAPQVQSDVEIVFIAVDFAQADRPGYGVSIHISPTSIEFDEGYDRPGQSRLVTTMPIASVGPPAGWSEVRIAMDLGAGASAIATVGPHTVTKLLDQEATATAVHLLLGTTDPAKGAGFTLYDDDVACHLR